MNPLILYVVQNKEGKFFRSKGYGGYGKTWVDEIEQAKIYTKIGQARARVTFFTNNYPEYGMPDIVVLEANIKGIANEAARVKKVIGRMKKEKEEREVRRKREVLKIAENDLRNAETRLKNLRETQSLYTCDDCNYNTANWVDKSDHHGGVKRVCRDRGLCHSRGG